MFALARPDSILQGAVLPTVRRSHARLDNGRYAIAVGDAHVAMDPVVGLGANSASLGAWTMGETILEGGPFDEAFCRKVDERRLPGVLAHGMLQQGARVLHERLQAGRQRVRVHSGTDSSQPPYNP